MGIYSMLKSKFRTEDSVNYVDWEKGPNTLGKTRTKFMQFTLLNLQIICFLCLHSILSF